MKRGPADEVNAHALERLVFFSDAVFAAGLAKARLVRTVLRSDLLPPDGGEVVVRGELRRRWIMPIAAPVTLLLAFVSTPWNCFAMFLVPVLKGLPRFRLMGRMEVE